MILGVRQCGKTYIINEFCKNEYKNYTYINLLDREDIVNLYKIPLEGFTDEDTFKLYYSDVGILNNKLGLSIKYILSDNISLYKGIIAENYVAEELTSKNYKLYYWRSNNDYEIDFVMQTAKGIIPVEVKQGDIAKSKSLNSYIENFKPEYAIRISSKDFWYNPKTKIKSVPLYAVFCIDNGYEEELKQYMKGNK